MESELSIFILDHEIGFYDGEGRRKTFFIASTFEEARKYFFEEVTFYTEEEQDVDIIDVRYSLWELWEAIRQESFSSLSEEEKKEVAEEWFWSPKNGWRISKYPTDNRCIQKQIEPLKEKISSLENRIRLDAFKSSEAMKEIPIPKEIVEYVIAPHL